ncbi:DUF503 family protein [Cytobacillus oceanisediminis]|jgi:hypothetical protein|uniref:DUF503 family protein n=2 Tax=Niallia TaxID=2837506 RepID=A0A941GGH5_NIACI|nr:MULTISPECIES: DUF503 family protein [Bacillaceae]EOR26375.1 YlxP-like protein [Niallia nealsonii AAU1]MBQ6446252.1 DUF503 family protein [Bacillus sp. (in: firmicutes)]MDU1845039.1 DUF503 family protein [Niallia nealsonii]MBZ9532667.1 DUF503 family protein [Cytobacillus oceanisediminis]MCB5235405.1 DUF503 family protein [Niallia circulans]
MIVGLMTVECIIYDAHSLKEKRAVLQRIMTRLKQKFNISISEVEYQDTWQRTKLAIVTVASVRVSAEGVLQQTQQFIDSFPEIERTITDIEWL